MKSNIYFILFNLSIFFSLEVYSQQDIYARGDITTANWWSDNPNPWYYTNWDNTQNRPDNGGRNYLKIDHNNNLSMTTNGAFFQIGSVDFLSPASSARTINSGGSGTGISLTIGIYNSSSASHTVNADLGIDASTVQFHNNSTGGMTFGGTIYVNSNTAQFGGSGTGNHIISGIITGTNGSISKVGNNTLTFTGQNSYTGNTNITAGTLQLNRSGGTTIPNSNDITVSGGTLRVSQNQELEDLTISSGGTLIIDAGVTLTINGVFTGGGTIQNNGNLILKGNSTFPGASSTITSMTNLDINRAAGVTLDKDITITGTLSLTDGILDISNNNLTVSSISGGSTTSYIRTSGTGTLIKQSITGSTLLPIGNSSYNPITLDNSNGYDWTVKVSDGITTTAGFNTLGAVQRTWSITPSTNPTASNTSITLQFDDSEGGANFDANQPVQAFKRNNTYWLRVGTAGNLGGPSTARTFAINGVTSFSDFGLSNAASPLPVTFTSLTGSIRNGRAQLSWHIADEVNVDHYEVEESADGRRFQPLTQVDAASRNSYQATDAQLNLGANYYRVKAVDIDGKLTFSKVIRLDNSAVDNNIRVYPNPSQGELTLGLNIAAGNYQIRLINAVGQTVFQQALTHEGGSRSLPLALPKLNTGIYQVEVRGGMQKYVKSVRIE